MIRDTYAELLFGEPEVLVAGKDLVNDATIRRVDSDLVTYVHILFDRHQVIWSAELTTESFCPGRRRQAASTLRLVNEICSLFPELDPLTGEGLRTAGTVAAAEFRGPGPSCVRAGCLMAWLAINPLRGGTCSRQGGQDRMRGLSKSGAHDREVDLLLAERNDRSGGRTARTTGAVALRWSTSTAMRAWPRRFTISFGAVGEILLSLRHGLGHSTAELNSPEFVAGKRFRMTYCWDARAAQSAVHPPVSRPVLDPSGSSA